MSCCPEERCRGGEGGGGLLPTHGIYRVNSRVKGGGSGRNPSQHAHHLLLTSPPPHTPTLTSRRNMVSAHRLARSCHSLSSLHEWKCSSGRSFHSSRSRD